MATVTCTAPVTPSSSARTFAVPAATPVTTPADDTVATAGLSLDQARSVIRASDGASPPSSRTMTASCSASPTARTRWSGITCTVATSSCGPVPSPLHAASASRTAAGSQE